MYLFIYLFDNLSFSDRDNTATLTCNIRNLKQNTLVTGRLITREGSKLGQAAMYQKDIIRILVMIMRDYAKLSLEDMYRVKKERIIWKVYIVYNLTEKLCSASSHND